MRWSFSQGRLLRLLRRLSGTLKTLHLSFFQGLTQGALRAPPLSLRLDMDSNRIQTAAITTRHGEYLEMERLETLVVGLHDSGADFQAELVRCCPALRELTVYMVSYDDNGLLADSVRIHCPQLHSLTIHHGTLAHRKVRSLVSNASKGGLRKLHFGPAGVGEGSLILDVLRFHAATLEDLHLSCNERVDLQLYLRLFTECPNLKAVTLLLHSANGFGFIFLSLLLMDQPFWVCRNLERLELGPYMCPRMETDLKNAGVLPPAWLPKSRLRHLFVPFTQRTMDSGEQEKIAGRMGKVMIQQLFEKVETLKRFTVDHCVFTCTPR